jgi:hypothetical protein
VVVTAILSPILTAAVAKRYQERQHAKQQANAVREEVTR